MEDILLKELERHYSKSEFEDFLLTWNHSIDDLKSIVLFAELLKDLHKKGLVYKFFNSGLAVSIFKDKSTRTRFSFSSAVNSLGLDLQQFDEEKSQASHGESVRETANMISFLTEVIGIRDDKFLGEGHNYQKMFSDAVDYGYKSNVLHQRPTIINLQSDIDHPTQSMSDLVKIKKHFGGFENIKNKKIAVTWAYSPSYGKPLSVSQGVIGLLSRFGADITLAHPEGYELMDEVVSLSEKEAHNSGGSFKKTNNMKEAFENADVVYPKSWAPKSILKEKTKHLKKGDFEKIKELEKETLQLNSKYKNWVCDRDKMATTNNALYMHPLPADIEGLNCKRGEVTKEVFDKNIIDTYEQASFKPFVITAIILIAKCSDPLSFIKGVIDKKEKRINF